MGRGDVCFDRKLRLTASAPIEIAENRFVQKILPGATRGGDRVRVNPEAGESLRLYEQRATGLVHSHEEFDVLATVEARVVIAYFVQDGLAQHDRGMRIDQLAA